MRRSRSPISSSPKRLLVKPARYRVGLIAALPEEADACLPGQGTARFDGPVPVRHVDLSMVDLSIATSGIGKVNAAIAATILATAHRCDFLMVVGTAGALRTCDADCFWVASAVQHDYGARELHGFVHYDAGAWPIGTASIVPMMAMDDPGLGLPHVRIASGDAFIACPDHACGLADALSAEIVDMETAAVAQAARALGVPWAAIKAVSDGADGDSSGDFQENLRHMARIAGRAAERFIDLLRPPR